MAQYDVHRMASTRRLVVIVQADLFDHLGSRVVVPLESASRVSAEALPKLKPRIVVAGEDYLFVASDIGPVLTRQLGDRIANVEDTHRDDITRALDLLLTGF